MRLTIGDYRTTHSDWRSLVMPDSELLVLVICDSVRKLKTQDVVSIEPIALQRIDDDGRLQSRLKVGKAQDDFLPGLLLPRDEADSFEAEEWSENMGNFSLRCVQRDALDIHGVCCVFGNR